MARDSGIEVLRCAPVNSLESWRISSLRWRLSRESNAINVVAFSQDMATMLDAGVTVREAVRALTLREDSAQRRVVFERLDAAISEGLSFSAALARTESFPPLLIATISASEQTGDLAVGLSRFAHHQHSVRVVRDKVVGACVYPLLLLAVGSLVVAMLLGVVVPRFATLIDSSNRELPLLSSLLMSWGRFVDSNPSVPIIVSAVSILILAVFVQQWRKPAVRLMLLELVPGVKGVVREFQHLQLYRTAAILTSRGITIQKALLYGLDLLGSTDRNRLDHSIAHMREGVSISQALSKAGLSDVVATSMLAVAERSGALPEMLDRIADFYERTLQRRIDVLSRLIEPVLMIVFGLIIGGIVILMYLPIFDLASSIN